MFSSFLTLIISLFFRKSTVLFAAGKYGTTPKCFKFLYSNFYHIGKIAGSVLMKSKIWQSYWSYF